MEREEENFSNTLALWIRLLHNSVSFCWYTYKLRFFSLSLWKVTSLLHLIRITMVIDHCPIMNDLEHVLCTIHDVRWD